MFRARDADADNVGATENENTLFSAPDVTEAFVSKCKEKQKDFNMFQSVKGFTALILSGTAKQTKPREEIMVEVQTKPKSV